MDCRRLPRNSTARRPTRLAEGAFCGEMSTVWAAGCERQRSGCQASLASMRKRRVCCQLGSFMPGRSCCGSARTKGLNTGVAASARRARWPCPSITLGSSMLAITLTAPPQCSQVSIQPLRPCHRHVARGRWFVGGLSLAPAASGRRHLFTQAVVRRKDPVVTREVDAWRRHQCGQPGYAILRASCPLPSALRASLRLFKIAAGDFVQRLKHHVRRAIPVRCRSRQRSREAAMSPGRPARSAPLTTLAPEIPYKPDISGCR